MNMDTPASIRIPLAYVLDRERRHRLWLLLGAVTAAGVAVGLMVYGFDYYILDAAHRVFSPKHRHLKPSGTVGLRLGFLGQFLFLLIFLYPIRRRLTWFAKGGNSKHWLDFHVLLGLVAPVVVTFHTSFKFHGIAGVAYWIMLAVVLSGLVGRYLYAQIPRSLDAAEMGLKEMQEQSAHLTEQLNRQRIFPAVVLAPLFKLPSAEQVQSMPLLASFWRILSLDLKRPFQVWRLRRRLLGRAGILRTLGGILPSQNGALERTIATARMQSALAKKILFLSKTRQVFHLWHVIHRPFSYSFAVLASVHFFIAMLLGYF